MRPTIMVFAEHATGDLLSEMLASYHALIHPAPPPPPDERVDLCVVDAPTFPQLKDWLRSKKIAEAPVDFPVLLVTTAEDLPALLHQAPVHVDGVLVLPFDAVELRSQVKALLRLRERSRQWQSQAERLASVSKAIESTSDAVSISDITGKAIYLNHAFKSLYGFEVNELNVRGIPDSLFVDPAIAKEIFATVQRGEPWRGETALKTRTGGIVPTLLRVDSIEDHAGRRIGLISVHTDITARKRAEAFEREQRAFERALRDSAAVLTGTLELDEVLDRILTNIRRVVAHQMAHIMLIEDGVAQVMRIRGFEDTQTEAWFFSQRYSTTETPELRGMVASGEPVIRNGDILQANGAYPFELRQIRSYIGVPIHLKGAAIGFLYLFSYQPDFFTLVHADRLQVFVEYAAIALQNARLHEKAQELATLQERQRLARELHDAVSQTLYSASMIAEALPRLWERDPMQVRPRLDQLHRLTRGALAEMRTLLLELRPSALTEADFEDLLYQLAEGLQGRTEVEVALTLHGHSSLPDDVQTALFYIAQEALNNVVKHAKATQVEVYLNNCQDCLDLRIIDNGRGFDSQQIATTSMGLAIMRERAEAIHASLSVTSQMGRGTRVEIAWAAAHHT